jgi:hypothetical protein
MELQNLPLQSTQDGRGIPDTTYSDCTHCWELGADEVSEGVVEIILCE